jgi:hypothetical protein
LGAERVIHRRRKAEWFEDGCCFSNSGIRRAARRWGKALSSKIYTTIIRSTEALIAVTEMARRHLMFSKGMLMGMLTVHDEINNSAIEYVYNLSLWLSQYSIPISTNPPPPKKMSSTRSKDQLTDRDQ